MTAASQTIQNNYRSMSRWWTRNGRKGIRPRSAYKVVDLQCLKNSSSGGVFSESVQLVPEYVKNQAIGKANERFKSDLYASAQVGTAIAEAKQSFGMIAKRSTQLIRFARALRRGHLRDASAILGLRSIPKGVRGKARESGNLFLEFHFGWAPLVKDIYEAVDVLQGTPKPTTVRGRGQSSDTFTQTDANWSKKNPDDQSGRRRVVKYSAKAQLIADVQVINPNLLLANQLGLTNPVGILWELVPYSFVVDWFVNVGQFIDSWTNYAGLKLIQPATTVVCLSNVSDHKKYWDPGWPDIFVEIQRFTFDRTLGLTAPKLFVRQTKALSVTRAATAVSLLVQSLKGH